MQPLTVGQMMTTRVKTLREGDSISAADWDMVVGELRHLPVVDRAGRLVGLVSDRDVEKSTWHLPATVDQVMTRDVHTVPPDLPAIEAIEYLLRSKHGAVPVVDARGRLLGMVTTTDFLELARRALSGLDIHQPHVRA